MKCSACSAILADGARFCNQCGVASPASGPASADATPRGSLEAAFGAQYRIDRLLGRGGMGAVYLAHETALDRPVAIKVLPPDRAETADSRERFRREARTAAKLTHPHIVPLHTFGEANGVMYFVMGYVRGESLAARLRRHGRLSVDETLRVLAEIAGALEYAHHLGVVHRDIKPDNVLIEEESGRAMLTDFGVAKAAGGGQTLTSTGMILGTPHYMSPEQASGKADVDGRSDIYSLGVMGYAMLAGVLPFEGKTAGDILAQHITKQPPPLESRVAGVSGIVTAAIMRCLAKDPAARWSDAKSLGSALLAASAVDDDLPEGLQPLGSFGLAAIACGAAFAGVIGLQTLWGTRTPAFVKVAAAMLLPLVFWAQAAEARKQGFGWGTILRTAFRQPRWWMWWYPIALRRPRSVWDRLPAGVRSFKNWSLATCIIGLAMLPLIVAQVSPAFTDNPEHGPFAWTRTAVLALRYPFGFCVLAMMALMVRCKVSLKRAGLTDREIGHFLGTADRSFWEKPHIAAVLVATSNATEQEASTPRTTEDIVLAMSRAAESLAGSLRDVATEALTAGRRIGFALGRLEKELRELARDADPAKQTRLEEDLLALGQEEHSEGENRRQMRGLLRKQLDLVHDLGVRRAEALSRRDHLTGLLRALWSEVMALGRASSNGGAVDTSTIEARIRSLCAEVGQALGDSNGVGTGPGITDLPTLER